MKSIWHEADSRGLRERIGRLRADAPARWGKFTAPQMVCHVTDGLKMAMGELQIPRRPGPLRYFPIKHLILFVLPFPKGAPTAPELLSRRAVEWGSEMQELERTFDRFLSQRERTDWPDHPAFGSMPPRTLGVLVYRHLDHHLKQFGV